MNHYAICLASSPSATFFLGLRNESSVSDMMIAMNISVKPITERTVSCSLKNTTPQMIPKMFSKLRMMDTLVGSSVFCAIVWNEKHIPEQMSPRYRTPIATAGVN